MASLSQEEENFVRIGLLIWNSKRAEQILSERNFYPLFKNEWNQLGKRKELSKLQYDILFQQDGESKENTFDLTLMVCLLSNLAIFNYYDVFPIENDDSKSAVARLSYHRKHLSHVKDGNMDSLFFTNAWSDIVGAVEILGDRRNFAECQELTIKTLDTHDNSIQRSEERKEGENKVDTALQHILKETSECLIEAGNCGTGKTLIARRLVLQFTKKGFDIIPVYDPHKFSSPIQPGGVCTRKLKLFDYISQQMDIVRYESITKGGSPSEIILIDCEDFYRNSFRLKKFENQRKVMLNIKTEKKQGRNFADLDLRKAEDNELMKMYKHNETENKHLSVMTFEKATNRQRNIDEYSIVSTYRTKEICMITLMHKSDLLECSKTSQFENIATLLKLCTIGTAANCVENRREQHILHNKGKNIEESECYKSTDTPWNEKHVLLERVAKIENYCEQMSAFVARSLKYSEDQTLWLEMHTEDLLNTAYKRLFQLLGTPDGNEYLCGEHMNDEEVCGVSVQIGDGAFEEKNQVLKQQLIECQMCIDQNNALFWCTNCKMNICSFCKMYHETVWTVMNHEVYPLHLLS